jgi:lipid-A-disaccharide synthase
MHVFISAGEPSGDLHGANLIRALRTQHPGIRITGFGGDKMEAAGADLLFKLTSLAVMWVGKVLSSLRTFIGLARQAVDHWEKDRPDLVVFIDYPGFNFALAKRAHALGIPVYFFVPPQLWAWASWRVKKVRRWFTGVLTALPFEDEWYRNRGVATHYIGHPYFDDLSRTQFDAAFIAEQRKKRGPIIALLPGSRNAEVANNFENMLRAAKLIHAALPDVRFLVASFNEEQAAAARAIESASGLPIEIHSGRTQEIIALAHSCIAVSGSVSLELMSRLKPAIIMYRDRSPIGGLLKWLVFHLLVKVKYITLVNLLAGEELYPEFATLRDSSGAMADQIVRWLKHPTEMAERVERLRKVRDVVAVPGACDRAASFLLASVQNPDAARTAA